jgi:crossover junction endodeoxyribonuclease RuvC
MRFVKFTKALNQIYDVWPITQVWFEEVRRHRGTDAAHVYGGLMGTLTAWCEERSIPYDGEPVGTIKKFWTGSGNADKEAMKAEARNRGFTVIDDNEADAIALRELKLSEERNDAIVPIPASRRSVPGVTQASAAR